MYKIGDWITIPQKEKNCLGESYNFIVGESYRIDKITGECITELSGHPCAVTMQRNFILVEKEINYQIY